MSSKNGFKQINGKWFHRCEGRYWAAEETREWQQRLVLRCPRCGKTWRDKRP